MTISAHNTSKQHHSSPTRHHLAELELEDVDSTFFRSVAVTRQEFRSLAHHTSYVPRIYRLWHAIGSLVRCRWGKQPIDPAKGCQHSVITGLPTVPPTNKYGRTWRVVIALVDGTYTAFGVPIYAAYAGQFHFQRWYIALSVTAGCLFVLDLLYLFHAGFVIQWRSKRYTVMQGTSIASHYIWRGTFWADLLSSVPLIIFLVAYPLTDTHQVYAIAQLLRLLRLFRLVRLPTALRRLAMLPAGASEGSDRWRRILRYTGGTLASFFIALYFTAMVINLLGCLWYAVAYVDRDTSWLVDVKGMDLTEGPMLDQYVASVYFITTTITSIGYGDIVATTTFDMCMSVLIMLCGIVVFGAVLGLLSNLLFNSPSRQQRLDQRLKELLSNVEEFLYLYSIPRELSTRVKRFFKNRHFESTSAQDMDALFSSFPPPLRWEVALAMMNPYQLSDPTVWPPVLCEARSLLLAYAELENISLWSDLWHQGQHVDHVVLLQEGVVDVFSGSRLLYTVHAPAWLGNPLHILQLAKDTTTNEVVHTEEDILRAITQRARQYGMRDPPASLAALTAQLTHNSVKGIKKQSSVMGGRQQQSADGGQMPSPSPTSAPSQPIPDASSAETPNVPPQQQYPQQSMTMHALDAAPEIDWGVRGCTARARRSCRILRIPQWVLEIAACEYPEVPITLAECIVGSFDRNMIAMNGGTSRPRLDHDSTAPLDASNSMGNGHEEDGDDDEGEDGDGKEEDGKEPGMQSLSITTRWRHVLGSRRRRGDATEAASGEGAEISSRHDDTQQGDGPECMAAPDVRVVR